MNKNIKIIVLLQDIIVTNNNLYKLFKIIK